MLGVLSLVRNHVSLWKSVTGLTAFLFRLQNLQGNPIGFAGDFSLSAFASPQPTQFIRSRFARFAETTCMLRSLSLTGLILRLIRFFIRFLSIFFAKIKLALLFINSVKNNSVVLNEKEN